MPVTADNNDDWLIGQFGHCAGARRHHPLDDDEARTPTPSGATLERR